jgi:subtilisin family serine protease
MFSGAAAAPSNLTQIGVDKAWERGYTGAGWYVAVLDSGVLNTHEYFSGKSIVEACFTSSSADNPNPRKCPNGEFTMEGVGAAAPYAGDSHGTHVAGIAVGKKPDGSLAGVAKDANLIAVQVFSDGYSGDEPIRSVYSDELKGLEYGYSKRGTLNIASVNLSSGAGEYASTCDASFTAYAAMARNLREAGIALVAAAGNESHCGGVNAPACLSSAAAIGSVDGADLKAESSNWSASLVPLFAPGVSIVSSVNTSNTAYESDSGTSMATPHVAGAWALARQARPGASADAILIAFKQTARPVTFNTCGSPTGVSKRIQVDEALTALAPAPVKAFDAQGLLLHFLLMLCAGL